MKTKKKTECKWTQGYATACAILAKEHGFTGWGRDLAREGGFNLQHFKDAKIEAQDLKDLIRDGLQ